MSFSTLAMVMILSLLAMLSGLAGCQPVTSDFEGKQRTAEQIEAQVEARLKEEARREEAEQKRAAAAVQAAADEAARAQRTLERRYAATIRGVDRQSEEAKVAASEEFSAQADAVGVELSRALAQITSARESASLERTGRVEGLQAAAREAIADIEAKEAARGAWANFASGVVSDPALAAAVGGLPGGGLVLGAIGVLTSLFGTYKVGQKVSEARTAKSFKTESDASYQEGFDAGAKSVQAKMDEANSAWDEAEAAQERKKKDLLFDAMLQRLSGGLPMVAAPAETAKAA